VWRIPARLAESAKLTEQGRCSGARIKGVQNSNRFRVRLRKTARARSPQQDCGMDGMKRRAIKWPARKMRKLWVSAGWAFFLWTTPGDFNNQEHPLKNGSRTYGLSG